MKLYALVVSKNFPTRSPTPSNPNNNRKKKAEAEKMRIWMKSTWRRKEDCSTMSQSEITSSNGSCDHTSTS